MLKTFIKNRLNQKLAIIIQEAKPGKGLAFIMHGLGGHKEQPHIKTMAEVFLKHGFTAIRFDTTNTFGESDGDYEDATVTNYYNDLEDVIEWSKSQPWYCQPFVLAGHSIGSMCISLYAEQHPERVKALAPISASVSGKLELSLHAPEDIEIWKKVGCQTKQKTRGLVKIKYSYWDDAIKYNLLPELPKLVMPVLMIAGENDKTLEQQRILFNALPGKKEFHVIKSAPHTFKDPEHLKELAEIFNSWIMENL